MFLQGPLVSEYYFLKMLTKRIWKKLENTLLKIALTRFISSTRMFIYFNQINIKTIKDFILTEPFCHFQ